MYIPMYNMYMALHIADPEVSDLVTDLAKLEGASKTETLRRLLRKAMAERQKDKARAGFREFAAGLVVTARRKNLSPSSKQEMDNLWGMNEFDGH
jgi:hypothetical protein